MSNHLIIRRGGSAVGISVRLAFGWLSVQTPVMIDISLKAKRNSFTVKQLATGVHATEALR